MAFPLSFRSAIVPLLLMALLGGCDRQGSQAPQATPSRLPVEDTGTPPAPAAPTRPKIDIIGKLDRSHRGAAPLALAFTDPAGKPVTLAAFKGRPVLLNLWATWCGPCVAEMPTLDQAAARLAVVAVSQDLGPDGAAKVRPFFAKAGIAQLRPYTDPQATLSIAYQAELPTSILYDSQQREVWRMAGGMDWTTPSATALLAEAK